MVLSIDLVLYVIAAICFALASINVKVGTANLMAVGLLAWVLTNIF